MKAFTITVQIAQCRNEGNQEAQGQFEEDERRSDGTFTGSGKRPIQWTDPNHSSGRSEEEREIPCIEN